MGYVGQQAIAWDNVDQDFCHHMVPLGPNEFQQWLQKILKSYILNDELIVTVKISDEYLMTAGCLVE